MSENNDGPYSQGQPQRLSSSSGIPPPAAARTPVVFGTSSSQLFVPQQTPHNLTNQSTFGGTSSISPFHNGSTAATSSGFASNLGENSNRFPAAPLPSQHQAILGHSSTFGISQGNAIGSTTTRKEAHPVVTSFGTSSNLVAPANIITSGGGTKFGSNFASNTFSSPFDSNNYFHRSNNIRASEHGNSYAGKLVFSQGSNVSTLEEVGRNSNFHNNHHHLTSSWNNNNSRDNHNNMGENSTMSTFAVTGSNNLGPFSSGVAQQSLGGTAVSSYTFVERNKMEKDDDEEEEEEVDFRHGIPDDNHHHHGVGETNFDTHASSPSFQVVEESSTTTTSGQPPLYRNKEWVNPNKKTNSVANAAAASLEVHEKKTKELALLRAKLEEKKKKMMEIKLKSQAMNTTENDVSLAKTWAKKEELQYRNQMPDYKEQQTITSSLDHDNQTVRQQLTRGDGESKGVVSSMAYLRSEANTKSDSEKKCDIDVVQPSIVNTGHLSRSLSGRQVPDDAEVRTGGNNRLQSQLINAPAPSSASVSSVLDSERNAELMTKNLKRFSQNQSRTTLSMLPKELQDRAQSNTTQSLIESEEEKKQTSEITRISADLVGTCVHMCPDEELMRRESENDIQLLELPHSAIHPKEWTLRETAIKRFRRSAADFKLDIPELVRPPHVLERVCGYLEEWVMERDRQGGDPRFGGQVPPPLDVYQFIWDRTRMVRKDFILQNYVGTGGKCNAIAVRCHERIARWHAMCEHQLSHLSEFISMQSQQNIQELGATMKSLNMYYDDAAGRSTDNAESFSSSSVHGCESSIVMGNNPIDYDGGSLRNACERVEQSSRIIGRTGISGTAEPEMRGLYILLTMNNDGGMEVLKYAARLLRDRPEIFQSIPVQLALQVYKAKREYNYARFFSLLRSKSTPYLYACIMFKYVESMRKAAFRIMSKTYGAKKKDDGEGIYDQYPLNDLVHLLCFEDDEEARCACEHYNITVKRLPLEGSSGGHVDIVFWRNSTFREPRDPVKGVVLRLKPKKMNRVIEKKLSGVTRLAICRGEVSGIGATLEQSGLTESRQVAERVKTSENVRPEVSSSEAQIIGTKEKAKEKEQHTVIQVAPVEPTPSKIPDDENRNKKPEFQFSYLKQIKQDGVNDLDNKAVILKRDEEKEEKIPQIDEEVRFKLAQKKNQLEIERQRKEEAQREKIRQEAEEQSRLLQKQRKELMAIRKQQEEVARQDRARQAEERRIEVDWRKKIEYAKKLLTWNKLITKFHAKYSVRMETQSQIESFNPLHRMDLNSLRREQYHLITPLERPLENTRPLSTGDVFYRLATDNSSPLVLHDLLFNELLSSGCFLAMNKMKFGNNVSKNCIMFKLGISLVGKYLDNDLINLVKMWIDQRLKLGRVWSKYEGMNEVRTLTQFCDKTDIESSDFDAILELNMFDNTMHDKNLQLYRENSFLYHVISIGKLNKNTDLDGMLLRGCKKIITDYTSSWRLCEMDEQTKIIEVISIRKLYYFLLRRGLCCVNLDRNVNYKVLSHHLQRDIKGNNADKVINHFLDVARFVIENVSCKQGIRSSWPYADFLTDGVVPRYFNEAEGLPKDWRTNTDKSRLEEFIWKVFPSMKTQKPMLIDILHDLVDEAPVDVQRHCSYLFNNYEYRECLETGLKWRESAKEHASNTCNVYLPLGRAMFITKLYFEEAIVPAKPVIPTSVLKLNRSVATMSEEYPNKHQEDDSHEENTVPSNLIVEPRSSHKRPPSIDFRHEKDQKKSKVESDELQKSKIFTNSLNNIYTNHEGIQNIVDDPIFSKLIASDAFLRDFVARKSMVQRSSFDE